MLAKRAEQRRSPGQHEVGAQHRPRNRPEIKLAAGDVGKYTACACGLSYSRYSLVTTPMPTVSCSLPHTSETRVLDAAVMPLSSPIRNLGVDDTLVEGNNTLGIHFVVRICHISLNKGILGYSAKFSRRAAYFPELCCIVSSCNITGSSDSATKWGLGASYKCVDASCDECPNADADWTPVIVSLSTGEGKVMPVSVSWTSNLVVCVVLYKTQGATNLSNSRV